MSIKFAIIYLSRGSEKKVVCTSELHNFEEAKWIKNKGKQFILIQNKQPYIVYKLYETKEEAEGALNRRIGYIKQDLVETASDFLTSDCEDEEFESDSGEVHSTNHKEANSKRLGENRAKAAAMRIAQNARMGSLLEFVNGEQAPSESDLSDSDPETAGTNNKSVGYVSRQDFNQLKEKLDHMCDVLSYIKDTHSSHGKAMKEVRGEISSLKDGFSSLQSDVEIIKNKIIVTPLAENTIYCDGINDVFIGNGFKLTAKQYLACCAQPKPSLFLRRVCKFVLNSNDDSNVQLLKEDTIRDFYERWMLQRNFPPEEKYTELRKFKDRLRSFRHDSKRSSPSDSWCSSSSGSSSDKDTPVYKRQRTVLKDKTNIPRRCNLTELMDNTDEEIVDIYEFRE